MKRKNNTKKPNQTLLSEYDSSRGVRGKYTKRFSEGKNLVVLGPDVRKNFPDSDSVNETLRTVANIALRKRMAV